MGGKVESQYQPFKIGKNIANFLVYILVMSDNDDRKSPAKWRCEEKGDDVNDDEHKPVTKSSCDKRGHDFILDNFDRKKPSQQIHYNKKYSKHIVQPIHLVLLELPCLLSVFCRNKEVLTLLLE